MTQNIGISEQFPKSLKYDTDGKYVRKWIDTLHDVKDPEALLRPWDFAKDWGLPIASVETQLTWQDRQRLDETGRITSID